MIVTRAGKVVNNKQQDFDHTRREFLKMLLSGAAGIAGAYALGALTPIAHAHGVPFVSPEHVIELEDVRKLKNVELPYVLVRVRDGVAEAIAPDGTIIAKSDNHAEVINRALEVCEIVICDPCSEFNITTIRVTQPGRKLYHLRAKLMPEKESTITEEWNRSPGIYIGANNVKLVDCVIDGSALSVDYDRSGIFVYGAKNVKIIDCEVREVVGTAFAVSHSEDVKFVRCKAEKNRNGEAPIYGFGFDIRYSSLVRVITCEALDNEQSNFRTHYSSNVHFIDCVAWYKTTYDRGENFDIYRSSNIIIDRPYVENNPDLTKAGISIYESCDDIRIIEPTIKYATIAIVSTVDEGEIGSVTIRGGKVKNSTGIRAMIVGSTTYSMSLGKLHIEGIEVDNAEYGLLIQGNTTINEMILTGVKMYNINLQGIQALDTVTITYGKIGNVYIDGANYQAIQMLCNGYVEVLGCTFRNISNLVKYIRIPNAQVYLLENMFDNPDCAKWYDVSPDNIRAIEMRGTLVDSGDGTKQDFDHVLPVALPSRKNVIIKTTPAHSDILTIVHTAFLVDTDADGKFETLRIHFTSAPPSGTNNVIVSWEIKYVS